MPSQWITCSRITWAFSRDNGLPWSSYWNYISPKYDIPVRTTLLSVGFCAIYGVIYIASTAAFNSIVNTTILMLNITFVVPQGILLTRGRKWLPKGPYTLGKFGYAVNAFSVVWMISCRDKAENLMYSTIPSVSMIEIEITENAIMIVVCIPLG